MSILKNFVNPWESTEALGSQALGTEALEGNIVDIKDEEGRKKPEQIAIKNDIGKGNIIFNMSRRYLNVEYGIAQDEIFAKKEIENNDLWDFCNVKGRVSGIAFLIDYFKKYPNTKINNLVFICHGGAGGLKMEGRWLINKRIKEYMDNTLWNKTPEYGEIQMLEYLGENMRIGGNIVFFGCGAGKIGEYGTIATGLGELFHSKGVDVNMYFNLDESKVASEYYDGIQYRHFPWNKGLTKADKYYIKNTGWRYVRTKTEANIIQNKIIRTDISISKYSYYGHPYPAIIEEVDL